MKCYMHPSIDATATCNLCGQPICSTCTLEVNGTPVCRPCAEKKAREQVGQATGTTRQAQPVNAVNSKNPVLAGILSIIPGLGQLYNGQTIKGIIFFLIACALYMTVCLGFIFHIYAIYEAYTTAVKINKGEPIKDWFK